MSEHPEPGGDRPPYELVARAADLLGLSDVEVTAVLKAGQSGSQVVGISVAGVPAVLKVTSDRRRLSPARRELEMFSRSGPHVSVFLPRLVGAHDAGDAVYLVTERLSGPRPVGSWDGSTWSALAERLGRLHAVTASMTLDAPAGSRPSLAELRERCTFWTEHSRAETAYHAVRILAGAQPPPRRLVLQHGDCHVENLVLDHSGDFRWIDWQSMTWGDGFADLAFLWQRAEFFGVTPPRSAMLRAYVNGRGLADDGDAWRRLAFAELELVFVAWPEFLPRGTDSARLQLMTRLEHLVAALW